MSLTIGNAPFSPKHAGRFNFPQEDLPDRVLYLHRTPKRVRVELGGETVADSRDVRMLHETGELPVYYFPEADVRMDLLELSDVRDDDPVKGVTRHWTVAAGDAVAEDAAWTHEDVPDGAPPLEGLVAFDFGAMDAWYVEDEQVHVHPRDPFHRVDIRRSTDHIRVRVDGVVVAETERAEVLFETGLPPRYYIPMDDVRDDLLVESTTTTGCPYKGEASYYSVKTEKAVHDDLAWTYLDPLRAAEPIKGLVAFLNERVDLEVVPAGDHA